MFIVCKVSYELERIYRRVPKLIIQIWAAKYTLRNSSYSEKGTFQEWTISLEKCELVISSQKA